MSMVWVQLRPSSLIFLADHLPVSRSASLPHTTGVAHRATENIRWKSSRLMQSTFRLKAKLTDDGERAKEIRIHPRAWDNASSESPLILQWVIARRNWKILSCSLFYS